MCVIAASDAVPDPSACRTRTDPAAERTDAMRVVDRSDFESSRTGIRLRGGMDQSVERGAAIA